MYCPKCGCSSLSKEIIAGSKTGDYVCDNCGEILTKGEILKEPPEKK